MSVSGTVELDRGPIYRLVRWMLLALVAAGVFGMHVLSPPDTGAGHSMVIGAINPAAAMAPSMSGVDNHRQAMDMRSASVASPDSFPAASAALTAPASQDLSGSMGMCLLFLAAGAAVIALVLLVNRVRRGTVDLAARLGGLWGTSRRGPPPSPLPPHSLCVLRV